MDDYLVLVTIVGVAVFGMAWMPMLSKKIGISYSLIYVIAGALLYTVLPAALPQPLPQKHEVATLRLAEIVVIISLMGTGIKIDHPFSVKKWKVPLRLVFGAMIICIGISAFAGYAFLSFDVPSAMLLGAVLAPTDPVLASDVQEGPPNERVKSEAKFSLTAEAGLNDGMAFPFTWLSVTLATMASGMGGNLFSWFGFDFVYRILAGLVAGFLIGKAVGFLIFRLAAKYSFCTHGTGFWLSHLPFWSMGQQR